MRIAKEVEDDMFRMKNESKALHLKRFFKTGKGEYGEGDKFLGITVPVTRCLVKKHKADAEIEDVKSLINSEWHEIRLAGFLLLIELYRKSANKSSCDSKNYIDFYLSNLDKGNNWDLVDLVAPYILGDWLHRHPEDRGMLDFLSNNNQSLWRQRVAIVSTFALIKEGVFDDTFRIAKKYLTHNHDLIHKSTGWMLREIGKRGGYDRLIEFLDQFAAVMPRTMLRYSIERFPSKLRLHYLAF